MLRTLARTKVAELPRRPPALAAPETTLGECVARMKDLGRGSTLVQDGEGRLLGIFTERDLLCRVDLGTGAWRQLPVGELMTRRPVAVLEGRPLSEALRLMAEGRFRTLPVVDEGGRVVASLSIRDILRHVAEHFPQELLNLPPEPELEASQRFGA